MIYLVTSIFLWFMKQNRGFCQMGNCNFAVSFIICIVRISDVSHITLNCIQYNYNSLSWVCISWKLYTFILSYCINNSLVLFWDNYTVKQTWGAKAYIYISSCLCVCVGGGICEGGLGMFGKGTGIDNRELNSWTIHQDIESGTATSCCLLLYLNYLYLNYP